MARYLLAASPLSGHVMPMVQIGADLQRRGHQVAVLTGVEHRPMVVGAGLPLLELPHDARVTPPPTSLTRLSLPALLRRYVLGRAELRSVFIAPLAAQFQALSTLLHRERFDAVLVDVAFTGAVPMLVGTEPRPPMLVCGVGPLTLSSVDTPPFGMAWQPEPAVDYGAMTAVTHRVLFGGIQREFDRVLSVLDSEPSPVFIADWPILADGLLQLTVPGFEYPRSDLPAAVEFVGPVLPERARAFHPPPWWGDLAQAPTVVHVTQGTHDNADLDQLIGPTLRALAHRDDVLVVATTGKPGGMSAPIPSNARVAVWVPYAELLPRVDVIVTNGGYGGVQQALSHGVPMVVAGETSDKAEIAARVAYSGAGVNLCTTTPSSRSLASAIDRVLTEPRYRRAAGALAQEIRLSSALDAIAARLEQATRTTAHVQDMAGHG